MRTLLTLIGALALATPVHALDTEVLATQTGGFYADGGTNNLLSFQNYFVGYGTTPGLPRTAERRSFFVFDLPPVAPGMMITAATLKLRLPFGGLIFGKDPGSPPPPIGVEPVTDLTETFALGYLAAPVGHVLDPGLTPAEAMAVFDVMADLPIAPPTVFVKGTSLPDPGDGGPPIVPIMLDPGAVSLLATKAGSAIVLSGWMPSWSFEDRPNPFPPPVFYESSELIFGLSDVHALPILTPTLVLTLSPVPELPTAWLGLAGLLLLGCARCRAQSQTG